MRKTFKYRLFPTAAQRTALQGQLDRCRWVYNRTLEARKEAWSQRQENMSRYWTNRLLTEWRANTPWLAEGHAQAMQDAQKRVDLAFRRFFRQAQAKQKAGYPRYKGRSRYDSFTYPQKNGNWSWPENGRLRLSKIGDVKIRLHRPLEGQVKTLTLYRDRIGNWYACFSCVVEPKPLPPNDRTVGVDLGLSVFATFSDGTRIPRKRWMRSDAKEIARLQRKKERCAKGSPERRAVLRALNHAYQRVVNRRTNFAHQESRKLVNAHQLVVFENLDITGMQANGNRIINQGIADVAWGQFVHLTRFKAAEAGRACVLVEPRGTTQECSGCGAIVVKDLTTRIHNCPYCGLRLDRELNAALNILARGLASLDPGPKSSLCNRENSHSTAAGELARLRWR